MAIPICGDTTLEPDETFEVRISSISATDGSAVQVRDASGQVAIIDNYRPSSDPLVMIADAKVYEGDTVRTPAGFTRVQLVVQVSKATSTPITLGYLTLDGTALGGAEGAPGMDYKATTGAIVLPTGSAGSRVIDVLIQGDTVTELDEAFQVQLLLPDGAPLVQKRSIATATILDDD